MKLHNKYISIFHEKNTIKIISFTCLTVLFDRDLVNLVILKFTKMLTKSNAGIDKNVKLMIKT